LCTKLKEEDERNFGLGRESQTAKTEQLLAAEGEERKTFAIRSVVNPTDGAEISLQQAILLGVILPDEGIYVNIVTGDKKPIPSAMSEGLIKVSTSSVSPMIVVRLYICKMHLRRFILKYFSGSFVSLLHPHLCTGKGDLLHRRGYHSRIVKSACIKTPTNIGA